MSGGGQTRPPQDLSVALKNAALRALGGGIPGAAAMGVQVLSLMWLRTTMNYQYRYGTTTTHALKTLYAEGGIPRFYRGLLPALFQGPLSRFGDTAANTGMLALLASYETTNSLPVAAKTACASVAAGVIRIFLMPIDACKTIMQVEGKKGFPALINKVQTGGPQVLFHGAIASAVATMVGHFPWFFTFNTLDAHLPRYNELHKKLLRNAFIGFTASVVSDTISNSFRVIKTVKQTSTTVISYPQTLKMVLAEHGVLGLMGRGLKTRILTNGLQGLMFTVLWKLFEEQYNKK